MSYLLGELIQLGLGREGSRGTAVSPQAWIPARSPSGMRTELEKVLLQETRVTSMNSQGSEITQRRAEGDLEFNVRNESIGYIFLNMLGELSSETTDGATTHTFTKRLGDPQLPSLTLALHQKNHQDYEFPLSMVNSLEISTPVDDLVNATAEFLASEENEASESFTPVFSDDESYFRNHDVTITVAENMSALDGEDPMEVKEFSVNINNNTRVNQNVSNYNPSDVFALLMEITGSFNVDWQGTTMYDLFREGTSRAMRIEMERTDLPSIGSSDLKPKIQITLPKITFESFDFDRPLDDIVTQNIDYTAHFSEEDDMGIEVKIQNAKESYDAEES